MEHVIQTLFQSVHEAIRTPSSKGTHLRKLNVNNPRDRVNWSSSCSCNCLRVTEKGKDLLLRLDPVASNSKELSFFCGSAGTGPSSRGNVGPDVANWGRRDEKESVNVRSVSGANLSPLIRALLMRLCIHLLKDELANCVSNKSGESYGARVKAAMINFYFVYSYT